MEGFVGVDRMAVVDALVERFQQVSTGEAGVQAVVLSSPPGWGKTRVLREVFARLAAAQPEPAYWPPQISDAAGRFGTGTLLAERKAVYPAEVMVPPGANMPWFWWGISCAELADGSLRSALFESAPQVWAHAEGLIGDGTAGAGSAFDITSAVIGVAGLLGLAVVPPVGMALTVGGAVRTGWQNKALLDRLKARLRPAQERTIASAPTRSQIQDLTEHIVKVARRIPVIVAIEDAYLAESPVVGMVEELLRAHRDARLLVIATTVPQARGASEVRPFPVWLSSTTSDRVSVIDLDPLSSADMAAIAASDLALLVPGDPGEAVVADLVDRCGGNPLMLRSVVRLPRVRHGLERGGPVDLGTLPSHLEDLVGQHFRSMPDAVQEVLARGATIGPSYPPAVVSEAAAVAGVRDPVDACDEAVDPYQWVEVTDDVLHTFIDPLLAEAAKRGGRDLLSEEMVADLLNRFERSEFAAPPAVAPDECTPFAVGLAVEPMLAQRVALARTAALPADARASAAARDLAAIAASRYAFREAVEMMRTAIRWDPGPSRQMRLTLATWLLDLGDPASLQEAEDEVLAVLSDFDPDMADGSTYADAVILLIKVRQNRQEAAQALVEVERLVPGALAALAADDPRSFELRYRRLIVQVVAGKAGPGDFERLAQEAAEALGVDHPVVLDILEMQGWALQVSGDRAHARRVARTVLDGRVRVLGPDHILTGVARSNLAELDLSLGDVRSALEQFEALVESMAPTLGEAHPLTTSARQKLALAQSRAGDVHGALATIQLLINDLQRWHGSDAQAPLYARAIQGKILVDGGVADIALSHLEMVLAEQAQVLPPDHPDLSLSRELLDRARRMSGRSKPPAVASKVPRNGPCPCGSGRKYKHCCGASS